MTTTAPIVSSSIRREDEASLCIILPVFNEEAAVAATLEGVLRVAAGRNWEILVVDDGSTDGTATALASFAQRVRIVRHPNNRGYGAALKTGIMSTRAENVLFLDGDGQHDPTDIPAFAEALSQWECVFSLRPRSSGIPWVRRPGKLILAATCNFLANQRIPDINSGFRAGRRTLFMRMLDLLPDGFSFSTTSLIYVLKSRHAYTFLPIRCHPRTGTSSVRIVHDGVKTLLLALRLAVLFDPLRTFGYPAAALVLTGLIYQTYIIFAYRLTIVGGALLSILTGVILFHFGLLADQISSLRKEISSHNSLFWEDRHRLAAQPGKPRPPDPEDAPRSP